MGFRPISSKNLENGQNSGNKKGPPQGAKAYVIWDVRLCGYYYLEVGGNLVRHAPSLPQHPLGCNRVLTAQIFALTVQKHGDPAHPG